MPPAVDSWEEVKKLAADFQRTQASTALQRLSDRNCIDVVKKLIELSLLDVIFTVDGKEYLTHEHLKREIEDELAVSGGRIHLTDLASLLRVDLTHINSKAAEIVAESGDEVTVVLGQLINTDYKDRLTEEINQKLSQDGVVTVSDLTKSYDLPTEFLESIINQGLGKTIDGVKDASDPRTIFTESYINQYRFKIRGILTALTRPISVSSIISKYGLPEKIAYSVIDSLISDGDISGSINVSSKIYTPTIFLRSQKEFVENFYRQNSYLEFETLSKVGISDPKSYISTKFGNVVILKTCAVSNSFLLQVDAAIEESVTSESLIDISTLLPSNLSEADIKILFNACVSSNKSLEGSCHLLCGNIVIPATLLTKLKCPLEESMHKKATADFKEGKLMTLFGQNKQSAAVSSIEDNSKSSRKEERKKKAATKTNTGGGTQGREVKIKATKKKYKPGQKGGGRNDDSDDDTDTSRLRRDSQGDSDALIFIPFAELVAEIKKTDKSLEDTHSDLPSELAELIYDDLNSKYVIIAKKVWEEYAVSATANKKKTHADLQSSLSSLYSSLYLYIKGLSAIKNDGLKSQLDKFLLKSLCNDAINLLLGYLSPEENINLSNPDTRNKFIAKLDSSHKESLTKLASASLDTFLEALEEAAAKLEIFIKPIDKKRESTLLSEHRQNLLLQLSESSDPGLTLHLAVLILFQRVTGAAIHASGKFVPQLIRELVDKLPPDTVALLSSCEQLVVSLVKTSKDGDSTEKESVEQQLQELSLKIKEIVK